MTELNRIKKLSGIEPVKEMDSPNILKTMPFMKAIRQYVEDQDGRIVGDYDVDEPRLYLDAGSMILDMQKMLKSEFPGVEIITIRQDPSTHFKEPISHYKD
jgi:hypothetical protein